MCTEAEFKNYMVKLQKPVVVRVSKKLRHATMGYLAGKKVQVLGYCDADAGRICLIRDGQRIKHKILLNLLNFDIASSKFEELLQK